ncbi:hypothetical protein BLL52_3396 [Rhodoferax antarcticus ANT.BR]|uniref:Uncharacterized protein n=1 Tax=Rhodoferax antarcticus ANT.BR TaxID=1111071 RepID=A0A1Q8YB15_9BURK|nr:hypothetical protein BLL52_3396 [Rhodoferax antarcticus ANT.BR]
MANPHLAKTTAALRIDEAGVRATAAVVVGYWNALEISSGDCSRICEAGAGPRTLQSPTAATSQESHSGKR